jgi:hypothetical protein
MISWSPTILYKQSTYRILVNIAIGVSHLIFVVKDFGLRERPPTLVCVLTFPVFHGLGVDARFMMGFGARKSSRAPDAYCRVIVCAGLWVFLVVTRHWNDCFLGSYHLVDEVTRHAAV